MTVSIIIAVKTWQKNLEECVSRCLDLDFPDFEVIVLPDSSVRTSISDSRLRIVPTGNVSPPVKRDMGINESKADIIAFIDDDAYPAKDWLKNAVGNFGKEEVAAVGGPAITPENEPFRQKASGIIYASFLVSAGFFYRYVAGGRKLYIDDYPSCNFLVRASTLKELGGFKNCFWPGEDTILCLQITKKLNKKIVYDPEVLVYHHRRSVFFPHLKQLAAYAMHRGYFVKKFPGNSRKPAYFVPTIFVFLFIGLSIASFFSAVLRNIYFGCCGLYVSLVLLFSIAGVMKESGTSALPGRKKIVLAGWVFLGIIMSHFAYGIYFLKGLLSRSLTR